jgi:chorismate-pyruvate lyase
VCAECGEQLEFAMDADDMTRTLHAAEPEIWVETGHQMGMRPADSSDLAASMEAASEEDARALLLARTLGIEGTGLVRAERTDWMDRFDRINASAEIRCILPCAHCGTRAVLDFDVAGFVWREIQVAARRLMAEIHRLASAYGWSEKAVMRMSAARRAAYLEMLNA